MPRKKTNQGIILESNVNNDYSEDKLVKSSKFSLITIILFLMVVGLSGFLIYDKFLSSMEFNFFNRDQDESVIGDNYQVPLGIFSSEQSAQQDPTTFWETFNFTLSPTTGERLYSFKYPKDLQVEQNGNLVKLSNISTSSEFQLLINFEDYEGDFSKWIKEQDKISATAWEGKPAIEIVTSSEATFMEIPALIRQQKMLAANLMSYVIYFKKEGKIFSISIVAPQLTQEIINFYLTFINNFKF